MKIWGDIPKISGVYNGQRRLNNIDGVRGVASKKDVVSISDKAKDYQAAIKTLKDVPDVRLDRVKELAEKYGAGTYDINGSDIAEKIIDAAFDRKA